MMAPSDDNSRPGRPADAKAWGLNQSKAPKLNPQEQARVADRNQLIVQVMEINAKQRHYENTYLGVKLELEHARRILREVGGDADQELAAQALEARFSALTKVLEKLVAERDFLEIALAEIDNAPLPKTGLPDRGRA